MCRPEPCFFSVDLFRKYVLEVLRGHTIIELILYVAEVFTIGMQRCNGDRGR